VRAPLEAAPSHAGKYTSSATAAMAERQAP